VAVDARIVSSGLPAEPGWTPAVPAATVLPTRGLGIDLGAHLYLLRFRSAAVGIGASWLTAKGSTSPPTVTPVGSPAPVAAVIPDVSTRVQSFAPQVSLNFGHALGWSYLSAGLGLVQATSEASLASSTTTFAPRDSGWVKAVNFGGGARWYPRDHIGFGFDVRWHKVSLVAASETHPGAPRASLFVVGAGIVLKP
jgi:hypothetical protein